jgi:hypothetical protein
MRKNQTSCRVTRYLAEDIVFDDLRVGRSQSRRKHYADPAAFFLVIDAHTSATPHLSVSKTQELVNMPSV